MLAVIVQRFTRPDAPRPYKVPIIFPVIVLLASVYLVVGPIIDEPQIEYLYASMFIFGGLLFYFPFVHYKLTIKFMSKCEKYCRLACALRLTNFCYSPGDNLSSKAPDGRPNRWTFARRWDGVYLNSVFFWHFQKLVTYISSDITD